MFRIKKSTAETVDHKVQRMKISGRIEAVASSAQQRIYMHENLHFSGSDLSVYNSLVPLQIIRGSVSIEHIRLSLVLVIQQHTVFRTAIRFNSMRNEIEQNILPFTEDIYSFQHSRGISTLEQLDRLLTNESIGKYFDVENGKVLRCHVVQRCTACNDDSLHEGDLVIFVIHHIAFDLSSYKPFLKAFERACWANEYQQSLLIIPQYIDFALYEQALLADTSAESKMNKARRFWTNLMQGYNWDKIRYLVRDEDRTDQHDSGRGYSPAFTIDQDVVESMMLFASTNNVTMFSLSLACYYAFLFKLTNHDDDLCIVSSAANRPEKEIQDMIAPASFAQARIWHDERIRFDPSKTRTAIYNMPFVYCLQPGHTLSIKQLHHALHLTVNKHHSLHTSLHFDIQKNLLIQQVVTRENKTDNNNMLSMIETTYETDEQLNEILHDEKRNPHLFDLAQGLVFRCHLVYYKQISSNHLLSHKDLLIFNFHHALFDFPSMNIFLHDLNQAYTTGQLLYDGNTNLRYLDYAVIEQQMSMTAASMFWLDALHDCKLDQSLPLPYDRYRLANEHRTCHATSISFDFGQDLSHDFLTHASLNDISLEHLTFAIYFIFLFKLTSRQTDLCLAVKINNNRYRDELKSIIGLFENVIPLRCQLDPHWCFHQLLEHVQDNIINCIKYSYFPLQRILNQHPHISNDAFLGTSLEFISYKSNNDNNAIMIGDSQLVPVSASIIDSQINKPICELSLILSNEQYLTQSLNNTQVSFSSPLACIHHEFVYQVMQHPQKLAVELDEQSLTYCELLHYVQILSLTLLNEYHIAPGDVVCQCVERSLSMVIGIMGIEMAGGVYCPLSPRDPQQRLHALIQQTQSRLVLVHWLTKPKFNNKVVSIDTHLTWINNDKISDLDVDQLSNITVTHNDIAYIIFTSGSTGVPKVFDNTNAIKHLRSLCSVGEPIPVKLRNLIANIGIPHCTVWNIYGSTELTVASTYHLVDIKSKNTSIPVGKSLPNYRSFVLNKFFQTTLISQKGELFIGGVGVFAGYLGRDDLTAKALIEIDCEVFYRIGDLVRMDNNGILHFQGRKDHQIKLRGQRIELGEIERCLLNIASVSACVVMKWNDDYLVAYVQSSHMNEEQLRQHCQSHLPPHMIPSVFIILDKLPLNSNGKVDRKQLPSPDFSLSTLLSADKSDTPLNQFEKRIHTIWCQVLHCNENHISRTTSFFSVGGHSLLFIQLYHHYQSVFNFDTHTLSTASFLQQPTIFQHSQLLQTVIMNNNKASQWYTLHINEGIASYAQERMFLNEKMRYSGEIAIYNELGILQVAKGSLSVYRLSQALRYVISKHKTLRTSLVFNEEDSILKQSITDKNLTFTLAADQAVEDEADLHNIISQISTNPNLFDLSSGRVFYCQILRQQRTPDEDHDKEMIKNSDVLIIGFHHIAIDQSGISIFLNDLCNNYNSNRTWLDDEESLQYIDYSIHERLIDMTPSREFWRSQLNGYNQECRLALPVDRHCLYSDQRSGYASIAHISFDNEILTSFFDYASSHQVTPFQLCLATFYTFLFKLAYRQNDLCISCLNANQYRAELQNMIGTFFSSSPYRLQVDSDWSFDEVVEHVREKCVSILEHSHYPLQHILTDSQLERSNVPFNETGLNFITFPEKTQWSIDTAMLQQLPIQQSYGAAKFDFVLTCFYNPTSDESKLSFRLTCSRDLFDEPTAVVVIQRLKHLSNQLFSSKLTSNEINPSLTSISKLSLILPIEAQEIENTVFCRKQNIVNEAPASYAQARILSDERIRFDPHKPKLAIYNMPFFYRLNKGHTLSIQQLRQALQLIIRKHQSFRTLLNFHVEKDSFMQRIVDIHLNNNRLYTFIENTYETQEQLNDIMDEEKYNSQLFNLSQDLVFRCHIVYYKQISSNHLLSHKDIIIFNFHHALFDFSSMNIFLHDLNQAYTTGQLLHDDNTNLRYLDYAVIEQQMSMTAASMFWLDALHDCKLDQSLSLPFDRHRLANEHRTGRGTSLSFNFGQDLSHDFLIYASSNNISLEHLTYAIYFIFLFKLTDEQTDLCLAINISNNRYIDELKSIIGLFENAIPLRCQLDPHWCFHQLLEHVREVTTESMKYSYFPLQRILNQHPHISKHAFLNTSLEFISYKSNNAMMIGDSEIVPGSSSFNINEDEILSASDFSLSINHDMNMDQLSCTIKASLDLFNRDTVETISQRFYFFLNQVSASIIDSQINKPICELSLILSNEQYLMQSLNNTQILFPSASTCIHYEFAYQVMKHPQKLAVELDEQSLTYGELLYYVQVLSLHLINKYGVVPGEIVCQCVERSLSMVIGIMAIEMAGGVYCPLSPRDPQHRLHALIQQTGSRLVLVHHLTKTKFSSNCILFDISLVLFSSNVDRENDVSGLENISITPDPIAYIIFTSGSTGAPKAIQIRHRNISQDMKSMVFIDAVNSNDIVAQTVRCSFDVHLLEIIGTLILGGTLVMFRPDGILDLEYFSSVIREKQITCIQAVPSLFRTLFSFFVETYQSFHSLCLRSLCISGEAFTPDLSKVLARCTAETCLIWNIYGPAETINSTFQRVYPAAETTMISIGLPMPNYLCLILDSYMQAVIIHEEGELYLGGVGVFSDYLGRDDLTAKALIEIDGQLFYRTGDLVRMDPEGLLYYIGRNDYQIKLHGQRIELGEVEQCLLRTSISASVVIKWKDDHLVAYVQSSDINEQELREHCQSHLPPHMTPSLFVVLDRLPLNTNGKIDRKLLPPPNFSSIYLTNQDKLLLPMNEIEMIIHHIWCEIFKLSQISTNTNIFTLGGHSLVIMQLFHRYKKQFDLEPNTLSITDLFQYATIIHHAQLIQQIKSIKHSIHDYQWLSLHIIQAPVSYAQERIFLDEQIRFSSTNNNTNIYVIPSIYRISSMNDHISISRLQHAFQSIIRKHQILRTALYLDTNGTIIQHCLDTNAIINDEKSSRFSIINLSDEEHEQNEIVKKILNQSDLFDLSIGHVINCHILRRDQLNHSFTHHNNDLLTKDDLILFTIHHACFDGASTSIFIRDLSLAYQSNDLLPIDDNSLEYIDYSIHEHIMDMISSQEFWQSELKGYNLTGQLSLPVDRQRSSNDQRSGLASTAEITFDNEICTSFLNYASSNHLTPFQLELSIFYVFLFKLTHNQTDLCISSINANRYRSELVDMIGMFVSTLPYCVELDPHWSFDEVVRYVQEKCLSILEHSHYPLQHILTDFHVNQSNVSFLETMFNFITISEDTSGLSLNGVNLEQVSLNNSYEMAKFDFSLNFIYNSSSYDNQLSCSFVCSSDLFDETTISQIAQRFQYMFEQLFQTQSSNIPVMHLSSSISKLSLILPDEAEEMKLVVFHRLENIINEAPASFAQALLWHNKSIHFTPHISQVPIYNMPFVYSIHLHHTLSVQHLRHTLQLIVTKHESLRTSLIFHAETDRFLQQIVDTNDNSRQLFTFIESTYETQEQLSDIMHEEKYNPRLFDLAQGLVFRCHIVYYKQISSNNLLSHKDLLIFNFHHALFDFSSMNIFLHDLNQAYTTSQLPNNDDTNLRYVDYAVIEQQMSMTAASMYWLDALHNCQLDQPLSLPFDRYRLANEHRTCHATSISFDFGQDLSYYLLTHASSNNISMKHLTFAIYFIFLFKLTNGQTDLCLAMNINNNRYRDELKSIVGLFENVIPLRCQLDLHWCFPQLLENVREVTTNSMKYSYFPLQHILNQHPHILKHAFLDTSLEFLSYENNNTVMIGDSQLVPASFSFDINEDETLSISDFSLSTYHDLNMNELACTINASLDLFNRETVEKISQRFHSILHQLSASIIDSQINKPIYELSLVLPNEQYLMQSMNNTQTSFSSALTCIHHEFVGQVMKHPQKLAVELDGQSLTYCELFAHVQMLAVHLLDEYGIIPTEVISQCVERSLSMIIGMMAIEMVGGVYFPLSFRDPKNRLHMLLQQTRSRLVLSHYLTKNKFNDTITLLDIDSILVNNNLFQHINIDQLSSVHVTIDSIAYIIFTSGSTGIPKGIRVRHRNFIQCIYSLMCIDSFTNNDTVIQMARCSFDNHIQEIFGSLIIGATVIMLHPRGTIELNYLAEIMRSKQVTYMHSVPSFLRNFFTFLKENHYLHFIKYLRSLCTVGEPCSIKLVNLILTDPTQHFTFWNLYGVTEITVASTFYPLNMVVKIDSIPVGRPLPNYRHLVLDKFLQAVTINQEGEIFIGGVGVFAGYLGRDDLTKRVLIEINGEIFDRTGDLVRMDHNGLLYFVGRKDFQIKLHGQRIELGEIERCLLNITSISACVVMKWKDDYLVAYVQSSHMNEEQLRQHCQSHLPPHMIPSFFIILDKLPLNPNGKVDRKHLPPPNFSSLTDSIDGNVPRNTLEQQLQDIFSQAFHTESPPVEIPFGQLGGTSLDAILALTLIRQQIWNKVDIGLLFTNPSIRQLAQAIAPLLVFEELEETASTVNEFHEIHDHLAPSFVIESLGVMLLVCQWLLPIMIIHRWCPLLFPILPVCHLLFYIICSRILSRRNIKDDNIFSWNYYRWWFLDRLWNNNTFWLQHILGTPLYNYYLRLCSARVSHNAHIYTTTIDAPWLLDIGDETWIADKTNLNCLYFNDDYTFTLHSIRIGCHCSISARSILFGGVDMQDNIIVQPMSSVTGFIGSRTTIDGDEHKSTSSDISITYSNRLLSIWHKIYQVITIISLICIHCTLLAIVYKVYSVQQISLPITIAFSWIFWSILACFITLFLLKFVVGCCVAGETYPIRSWSYLHKVWLRQLIVSSFHHAWSLPTGFDHLYPCILRWLGAQVGDDVKLGSIDTFLSYPTNLLKFETGVTSFAYVLLVPTEMTLEGDHRVDWITLGSHTNLANVCSILPGSHLASHTMVGNLTRITRETNNKNGDVYIGVPARAMPFQMPIRQAMKDQIKTTPFWKTCFSHYISKCLLIGIYWSCGFIVGSIIHTIIVCSIYKWYSYGDKKISNQIIERLQDDHRIFIGSFLGNTQWLIRLFRAYGANIGNNVILPDICSIFDYNLVTIGDHVRLNINAIIVCHTFEQRILKLVPVTVGNSCILMSGSIVMPGCKLMGNNRLYPFTLVMKNDLLQSDTQWKGLPALIFCKFHFVHGDLWIFLYLHY
ncbi:unnamed protein product [Adineta steineri]|uniref:Carrier domain-containing protein n=1 Tax=Adineta steineri TaxID=433720 RepID=A0A819FXP5_9BILA|nr:unnamed protein product [Adineta steineri]